MRFSVFMLTVLIPLAAPSVLDAQDANEQASSVREPVFDIGEVEVPEGSTADVLEFLQDISQLAKGHCGRLPYRDVKNLAAQGEASKQLLEKAEIFPTNNSLALRVSVRHAGARDCLGQSAGAAQVLDLVTRQLKIGVARGLQPRKFRAHPRWRVTWNGMVTRH